MKELATYFKNCSLKIWEQEFSVLQVKEIPPNFFAAIRDHQELSLVAETNSYPEDIVLKAEDGWKLISFEAVLPFELVGFLAAVSKVLADQNISIFALSAYSTDHILVKEEHLVRTIKALRELGCTLN